MRWMVWYHQTGILPGKLEEIEMSIEIEVLLKEVLHIRQDHKRIGTRKLYEMLALVMMEH